MAITVEKLQLSQLSDDQKKAYELLTEPRYRIGLEGKDPDGVSKGEVIAIGAEENGVPVGLLLASHYAATFLGELFTIYVLPSHRRMGIGAQLLEKLESSFSGEVSSTFVFHYKKNDPTAPYLEKILEKHHWGTPQRFMIRYFYDCFTFSPVWFRREMKYPPDFTEFPWVHLKSKDVEYLKKQERNNQFDYSVSPFLFGGKYEPINSLGLRHRGKVVGWMITHRVAPDTIRYTSLYIDPEYQNTGYSINLLIHSIKQQQQSSVKWSIFEIVLDKVSSRWVKFVEKRLRPHSYWVDEVYRSWKVLG